MKLVFIVTNGKTMGGGDLAQFFFANALYDLGHKVHVFAANNHPSLHRLKVPITFWNELPISVKRIGIGRVNALWRNIFVKTVVSNHIKKQNPDYVIGYLREPAILATKLAQKHGTRSVNFVFETPVWLEEQLGSRFTDTYYGSFKKSWERTLGTYKDSDLLIPNSKLTQKACAQWTGREITEPVYPGLDVPKVKRKKGDYIVTISRLNAYKNIDVILQAMGKMDNPPKLKIMGSGEQEEQLRALAEKLKLDVDFMGKVDEQTKWSVLAGAQMMVFPSSFEGFGMPPGESLGVGVPCVASNLPILKEVYGKHLIYFKENDVDDLVKKMRKTLSNPPVMTQAKDYVKRYSWKTSALRIQEILERGL